MNSIKSLLTLTTALTLLFTGLHAAADTQKIGTVNFKTCIENSKLGKQEQASFDALKNQMESSLGQREKDLNEIGAKFNDPDYLDSLSPDAEAELKHKFRTLNQEMSQLQSQYYQTLNQANYKIMQKVGESIAEASKIVAVEKKLDLIINEDGCFFCDNTLNVSQDIVTQMDKTFDREAKEATEN